MTPESSDSPDKMERSPWPKVVMVLGLSVIVAGAAIWAVQQMVSAPGVVVKGAGDTVVKVAEAFRQGTVKQEFVSSSIKLAGTTRLQVATLQEHETFRRAERDKLVWGLIWLPDIVVQAEVPVDYTYYLDLNGTWDFSAEKDEVVVRAPAIQANAPAPDISKLTFYTLEGHVWQDDKGVRSRLQGTLSDALRQRAVEHVSLVREIARKQTESFVRTWLAKNFGDADTLQVKVVFPEEEAPAAATPRVMVN